MLIHIKEGLRIFKNSLKPRFQGHNIYIGSPKDICKRIVDDCWNSKQKYFMTSTGNFSQFWSRDFGICASALMNLGFKDNVIKTLDYALSRFEKAKKITTTISPDGIPYDFPKYASDSVPFIMHSLKTAKAKDIIKKYERFLLNEIERYCEIVFDKETGMARSDRGFSSMKDYSERKSSIYDNCMLAMLKKDLDDLDFFNPLHDFDIKKKIKKELWNEEFFYDDMKKLDNVYGDANVFPFWTGVFTDKSMFESCLEQIKKAGLDRPFPLKYSAKKRVAGQRMVWQELFVGDYERHAVWMNVGLCYLDVLRRFRKRADLKKHLGQYLKLVDEHKNFLEVYNSEGEPFRSLFYYTDAGMLWATKLVDLTTSK